MCPPPQADADQHVLLVSFRLPDCRDGSLEWTYFRSKVPQFGVADTALETSRVSGDAWWKELAERVASSGAPVIYIHGYFSSQDDAIRRALGIRALLCPRETHLDAIPHCRPTRPVVALSWPSHDTFAKYTWDEANSEWAADHAVRVILDIAKRHPGTIVIAHSMGNRILVPAALAAARERLSLGHVVMASADVDRGYIVNLLEEPAGLGFPATIYASRKDQALSASWRTHGYPRAGDISNWVSGRVHGYPYRAFPNAEIVDTTEVRADRAAHRAFIASQEAAADLCRILAKPGSIKGGSYRILRQGVAPDDECALRAWGAVMIAEGKSLKR